MSIIRILHVVGQMNHGGIETFLMNVYRNVDRNRIQFDFLTFRETRGYFDDEIEALGGKVFYFQPINLKKILMGNMDRSLYNFFIIHPEYKIVHSHMVWSGLILKSAQHAKVSVRIAHSHGDYTRIPLGKIAVKNVIKNIMKLSANQYATHRFACSKNAGQWHFGNKNWHHGNVSVWPNAIDCDKFQYDPQLRKRMRYELGLMDDTFTLIHVGRVNPHKNHMFLIDIFDSLMVKVPNSKLLLIGGDEMDGECQRYAFRKKSAKDILFLGTRSDIKDLLQAGDIFVFPSFNEGFGISVLEAQASGLPCLISNTIPSEVCLTDNIIQLPINEGSNIWVNNILEFKDKERADNYCTLVEKGYDIHELCQKLCAFYENTYAEQA